MKLIDILVQELPKRGGWPHGSERCMQTDGLYVTFPDIGDHCDFVAKCMAEGVRIATREQYEAALAASKPEWNGEGLPNIGCEIEVNSPLYGWKVAVVTAITDSWIVAKYSNGVEFAGCHRSLEGNKGWTDNHSIFRPICSEVDKKRAEAIKKICEVLSVGKSTEDDAKNIYEYIKSGKIVID